MRSNQTILYHDLLHQQATVVATVMRAVLPCQCCARRHTLWRTGGAGGVEVEERGKPEGAEHEVGLAGSA